MTKGRFQRDPQYDEAALAVGRVCMGYSDLERSCRGFAAELIGAIDNEYRVVHPAMSAIGMSVLLDMIRIAGHAQPISEVWLDELRRFLKYVDKTLRPARNAYAHGNWVAFEENSIEIWQGAQYPKDAVVNGVKAVTGKKRIIIPIADLFDLSDAIQDEYLFLNGVLIPQVLFGPWQPDKIAEARPARTFQMPDAVREYIGFSGFR